MYRYSMIPVSPEHNHTLGEGENDDGGAEATDRSSSRGGRRNMSNNGGGSNQLECKVFFWQGREANNAGWLTFTFMYQKRFKDIEIIKMHQQQESPQFLAHFKRKFVIHKGKRPSAAHSSPAATSSSVAAAASTRMYHLRRNPHSIICLRCIELEQARADLLCSVFCYLVVVPFVQTSAAAAAAVTNSAHDSDDNDDGTSTASNVTMGIVYVWIGGKADPDEAHIAAEIAHQLYSVCYT